MKRAQQRVIDDSAARKLAFLKAAEAPETNRALQKQWRAFEKWSKENKLDGFPCDVSIYEAYFVYLVTKGLKRAGLDQAKWAIDTWHRRNKVAIISDLPEIKVFFKGIYRTIGFQQIQKKDLTIDHIKTMNFADNLTGLRDKLLFLIGFTGGLRRSELTDVRVQDLEFNSFGVRVWIRKSKTNQEGRREVVDLSYAKDKNLCPVLTLKHWLKQSSIENGYLFQSFYRGQILSQRRLSGHHVARIIKKYVVTIGLSADQFSGHSLRAGCATYLLSKKVPLNLVAKQLRHKKVDTTMKYDRNEVSSLFSQLY
ncbi:MAG: site-specific integrase [SAR324 cluster bacterium]|nr:site-specific integrase [SAR324 cluster bacterium]